MYRISWIKLIWDSRNTWKKKAKITFYTVKRKRETYKNLSNVNYCITTLYYVQNHITVFACALRVLWFNLNINYLSYKPLKRLNFHSTKISINRNRALNILCRSKNISNMLLLSKCPKYCDFTAYNLTSPGITIRNYILIIYNLKFRKCTQYHNSIVKKSTNLKMFEIVY